MASINDLTLAVNLTERVSEASISLESGDAPILSQVSETTAELLKFWFQQDYIDNRGFNFHEGQRKAILNVIYAHEVLGMTTLKGLYAEVAPQVLLSSAQAAEIIGATKNDYPKYCLKMATGTGKTWVLQALMIWQVLNANRDAGSPRYTKNFLVVAPGLIVYERLRDAFEGKERGGKRDFATSSDFAVYQELFTPDAYRDEIFGFVQGNVCAKEEIGRKVTAGGLIAVANWHILSEEAEDELEEHTIAPGDKPDAADVVNSLLPLTPGTSQGNDLNVLNRQYERGSILTYLSALPSLLVFNDEAHHIHDFKREGEVSEVEWQKSLNLIAKPKAHRFFQVDFSATPYNEVGTGKQAKKTFFPHIVVDFDLKTAMRQGLVKSLVLDKRSELGALNNEDLDFRAYRDEDGNPQLSEGQRIMLRAGLTKLRKLDKYFSKIPPHRHPKMLVVCEDTSVTPLVEDFLKTAEGLTEQEILRVDSNRKGELKSDEWMRLRERLFDVDRHATPRVIISVLMLREGFDVNNICVIVPLRASSAGILLEQTIGRGLRLMWRDEGRSFSTVYEDMKRENRALIRQGKTPSSMIDILSIIEHPAFLEFYADLIREGLVAETEDEDETAGSSNGDLIAVGLRPGYEEFDFAIPFILREKEEEIRTREINVEGLSPFVGFDLGKAKGMLGSGERFHSLDVQDRTKFGDYRVNGGVMTATGYNDYLGRIVRRITEALSQPLTDSSTRFKQVTQFPHVQINRAELAEGIDLYIRTALFGQPIDPLADDTWRVLLLDPVTSHIIKVWARQLMEAEGASVASEAEVTHRWLSETSKLTMRESSSLAVTKSIYRRLPFPSRSGGLERAFIESSDRDASVDAFCKLDEQKHSYTRLRYVKEDGLAAFYHPDFLVRCGEHIYLVETKAQGQVTTPNVVRKKRAAVSWCDRINTLLLEQRGNAEWHYVLLGEGVFYDWRDKGASIRETLDYAKLRPIDERIQAKLSF
jgi:type III restriction enzyme